MSDEKQETTVDIVREMRHGFDKSWHDIDREWAHGLSDRIEAAWKREREASRAYWTKKCRDTITEHDRYCSPVGNAAAMREALTKIYDLTNALDEECAVDPVEIRDIARSALSAPVRNCDVGTADEQTKRMRNNCNKYKPSCIGCKYVTDLQKENCWLAWAQMPYEAEEGSAE